MPTGRVRLPTRKVYYLQEGAIILLGGFVALQGESVTLQDGLRDQAQGIKEQKIISL